MVTNHQIEVVDESCVMERVYVLFIYEMGTYLIDAHLFWYGFLCYLFRLSQ